MQQYLQLDEVPLHIECFDNSNFQGAFPVSAMVCFKNGIPSKNDYRRFNVKTVKDHPFPWKENIPNPDAKPDLRNKKKPNGENKSRKSEASKKNKKRWY